MSFFFLKSPLSESWGQRLRQDRVNIFKAAKQELKVILTSGFHEIRRMGCALSQFKSVKIHLELLDFQWKLNNFAGNP